VFIVKEVKGKSRVIGRRKATGPVLKTERANSRKLEDAKLIEPNAKSYGSQLPKIKSGFKNRG